MDLFSDRRALVTGASRGAPAPAFARAVVALVARPGVALLEPVPRGV